MELQSQFEAAVAASKQLSEKPSNEILLKLYALYKQATEGDNASDGPANPFDFVGKAKHDAWESLKGTSKESAMEQYAKLVEELKNK